jgi:NB-ARC domain-containing protein
MSVQQGASQHQRPRWRRGSWIRVLIFVVCLLIIIVSVIATAFQFLSPLVGVILTTLPILVALATWLFPLPPMTDTPSEIPFSTQPIQFSVMVQAPSASLSSSSQATDQQADQKTIWNVPYRRNPYFTGREEVLQALHERLSIATTTALTQSQAISGLGGIGKTQIVVEYAYRHCEEYHFILWVNAATRDTIIASFLELATLLNLPEQHNADQSQVVFYVNHWFTKHKQWLLIFDNADDLALANEFLPTSNTGSLLLTTRNQSAGTLATSLAIDTMDNEEGTSFILWRAKLLARDKHLEHADLEKRTQAEQIVEIMDGLPLALDQAAAYIEETQCTLSAFLEKYQLQRDEILRRRGGTGNDHPLPVATTWSLSFTQVRQSNPAAADLLRVCVSCS